MPIGRNYDQDEPESILQDFEQVILDQDKRVVESQRPKQVPFDYTEELHLKFDVVAMNYRRAMKNKNWTIKKTMELISKFKSNTYVDFYSCSYGYFELRYYLSFDFCYDLSCKIVVAFVPFWSQLGLHHL